ncbi:MAG TPA: hypothetical protein V6D35_21135 [Candidatus Sericytochromatia bacterium]
MKTTNSPSTPAAAKNPMVHGNQMHAGFRVQGKHHWIIIPLSCDDITGEMPKRSAPILPLLQLKTNLN